MDIELDDVLVVVVVVELLVPASLLSSGAGAAAMEPGALELKGPPELMPPDVEELVPRDELIGADDVGCASTGAAPTAKAAMAAINLNLIGTPFVLCADRRAFPSPRKRTLRSGAGFPGAALNLKAAICARAASG